MIYDLIIVGGTVEGWYAALAAQQKGVQNVLVVAHEQNKFRGESENSNSTRKENINHLNLMEGEVLELRKDADNSSLKLTVYQPERGVCYINATVVLLANGYIKKNGRLLPDYEFIHASSLQMDATSCGIVVNDKFQTSIENVYACGNILYIYTSLYKLYQDVKSAITCICSILRLS